MNVFVINAIFGLNWHVSLRNTLYGELAGGLAIINSQNFHLADASIFMTHLNKEVNHFDYGVALGWRYEVTRQTGVEVAIGYQVLGNALLGTRVVPDGASSTGEVAQTLRGLTGRVGLVHWF